MGNALEPAAVFLCPAVGKLLTKLRDTKGVLGAALSGSGPTVFGLTEGEGTARKLAVAAAVGGCWTAVIRTLGREEMAPFGRIIE